MVFQEMKKNRAASQAITNDGIHTFFIHYFSSSFHIQPHKIMAVNLTHFFIPSCYQRAVIVFIALGAAAGAHCRLNYRSTVTVRFANKLNDAIRV